MSASEQLATMQALLIELRVSDMYPASEAARPCPSLDLSTSRMQMR